MKRRRVHQVVFALAGVYNLGWGLYAAIDPQDPRKQLAEEVAFTLKTRTAVAAAGAAAMFNGLVGRDAVESDGVAPDAEDVESADSSLDGVGSENRLGQAAGRGSL